MRRRKRELRVKNWRTRSDGERDTFKGKEAKAFAHNMPAMWQAFL